MRVKTKMPELLPRPIGNILRKLTHLGGGAKHPKARSIPTSTVAHTFHASTTNRLPLPGSISTNSLVAE